MGDRREWLQLAHTYEVGTRSIGGWFASVKLDGQLCVYDGGITRGMKATEVPWANTVKDKTTRYCTGLWSRGGKPIAAPDVWLDKLPSVLMVGELYAGRGQFQRTESVVRKHFGDAAEWNGIKLMPFDMPSPDMLFKPGRIHSRFWRVTWGLSLLAWAQSRLSKANVRCADRWNAERSFAFLKSLHSDVIAPVPQTMLPFSDAKAQEMLDKMLADEIALGGEGIILRHPSSIWEPKRSHDYLKYKPTYDAEGVVVGFTFGEETNDGSKHRGRMGALLVEWNGKRFKISGFTDAERVVTRNDGIGNPAVSDTYPWDHPGDIAPDHYDCGDFKRGDTVTFTYLKLTDSGVPYSANYWRKRNDE